jgi:hypothetical protein
MFDTYRPSGQLKCPACGALLTEWQGKDGPCGLLVWKQGVASPIGDQLTEECRLSSPELALKRLPDRFEIYSYDCRSHQPVTARCMCVNGVWSVTEIEEHAV